MSAVVFAQSIVSLSPNAAKQGETLNVTIVGQSTNFTAGVTEVAFVYNGASQTTAISGQNIVVINDSTIQVSVTVPDEIYLQYLNFKLVSNANGTLTKNAAFLIKTKQPSVKSLLPNQANRGDNLTVTIVGENTKFTNGVGALILYGGSSPTGTTLTGQNLTVINDTSLTADIVVPSNAYLGNYALSFATQNGNFTKDNAFLVNVNSQADPVLKSASPNSLKEGSAITITIVGKNTTFSNGVNSFRIQNYLGSPTVILFATNIIVLNDSTFTANLDVPANTLAGGYYCIANTNAHGEIFTATNNFVIEEDPTNDFLLKSVLPNDGERGQTLTVTIVGQNAKFTSGVSQVKMETYTYINGSPTTTIIYGQNVLVLNDDSLTARFFIPQNAILGYYDVYVSFSNAITQKHNGFYVTTVIPEIASLSKNEAIKGDGFNLTVIGKNTTFTSGVSSVKLDYFFKNVVNPTQITGTVINVINDTMLNVDFMIPATAYLGIYNLIVQTTANDDVVSDPIFNVYAPGNSISGTIIDGEIGKSVILKNTNGDTIATDTVDANLYFEFTEIADGTYDMYMEGLSASAVQVVVSGGTDEVAILLKANGAMLDFVTAVVDLTETQIASIYPNPTSDQLTISVKNDSDLNKVSLIIYNSLGQALAQKTIENYNGISTLMDVSAFSAGNYFLRVLVDNTVMKTLPFVVEK